MYLPNHFCFSSAGIACQGLGSAWSNNRNCDMFSLLVSIFARLARVNLRFITTTRRLFEIDARPKFFRPSTPARASRSLTLTLVRFLSIFRVWSVVRLNRIRRQFAWETGMRYMLLIYTNEHATLTPEESQAVIAGHRAAMDEASRRGFLRGAEPLFPTAMATTV